jgi:palmitoyltransferase ZDHHC9/14/18
MPPVQRKWEIFPGKNSFYCNGRVVMGRQAGIFYVTLLLVIGTSGLFFAFDCPFLTERISPVIPVVGAVLFIFVLSNLLKTSFSDPGIIPRATNAEAESIEREIEQPVGAGQAYRPPPRTKEIQVSGCSCLLQCIAPSAPVPRGWVEPLPMPAVNRFQRCIAWPPEAPLKAM